MREMKVMCARFNQQANYIEVIREFTNDDGTVEYNGLSVPLEKLEWLSAEYEIDDQDELAEFVLYESLLPPDDQHPNATSARSQRRSRMNAIKQQLGPMNPSGSVAAIKAKLRDAGLPETFVNAVDDNPIDVIKQHSRMNLEDLQAKRNYIRSVRNREPVSFKSTPTAPKSSEVRNRQITSPEIKLPRVELVGGRRVRSNNG